MDDSFDLQRFVEAQAMVYPQVVEELSHGRKRTHWMWFVFPQIAGLGFSAIAQHFAIVSRAEASAYLEHDLLGPRLVDSTRLVMAASENTITDILGSPDDIKFRSCMTLFDAVSKQEIFAEAIAAFCPDGKDRATLEILKKARSAIAAARQAAGTPSLPDCSVPGVQRNRIKLVAAGIHRNHERAPRGLAESRQVP